MTVSHGDMGVGKDLTIDVVSHFGREIEDAERACGGGRHDGVQSAVCAGAGERLVKTAMPWRC